MFQDECTYNTSLDIYRNYILFLKSRIPKTVDGMLVHVKHCLHKMNYGKSCKNCYKVLDYKSKWYPS